MSRRPRSILCKWTGTVFEPSPAFLAYASREFEVGEVYPLQPVEERSMKSHNQYFAALSEGFNNLNEEAAKRFPTPEHLRKWALVQCGYCSETNYVMASEAEARKLAADMRRLDEFCVMQIHENTLIVWVAESQSIPSMKKEIFQESKEAVLDLVATMARTTRGQLQKEARHHGR